MSVIVKGMEMPTGCYTCPILQSEDNGFDFECPFNSYLHWHDAGDVINYMPDSCPLVEVPTPHGRLIDAYALLKIIKESGMLTSGICWAINVTPTIIEAEVSE